MAVLAVNQVNSSIADAEAVMTAAAGGGDSFPNTGREWLEVLNGGGGAITVTISSSTAATKCSFGVTGTQHDRAVTINAGKRGRIGPLPTAQFNDSNGRAQITYSGVTSVTVGVFAVPQST